MSTVLDKLAHLSPKQRALFLKKIKASSTLLNKKNDDIPLVKVSRDKPLPLSFSQKRLWFLSKLEDNNEAYNMPFGLHIRGRLNKVAIKKTLDCIVARHEILRTSFSFVEYEPVQNITPADTGFLLDEIDLSHVEYTEALEQSTHLAVEEARKPFNFDTGPLIRGKLITLIKEEGKEENVLLITMHHIASDGWSMAIITQELTSLYQAFANGEANPLPELPIQYADYSVWQHQWLTDDVLIAQSDYWLKTLEGAPLLHTVPMDRARAAQVDYSGSTVEFALDATLTKGLKALSQRHDTTLFMTVLTAWAILLSRLSNQSDLVIGTPVANRPRVEIEALIGFFVNTLALRINVGASMTCAELLKSIKSVSLDAQQNQDLPFEQVVESVNTSRNLSHAPIFQLVFLLAE